MNEITQTLISEARQLQNEIVGSMNTTVEKSIALGERLVKIKKDGSMPMQDAYDEIGISRQWGSVVMNAYYNRDKYELGMSVKELAQKSKPGLQVPPTAPKEPLESEPEEFIKPEYGDVELTLELVMQERPPKNATLKFDTEDQVRRSMDIAGKFETFGKLMSRYCATQLVNMAKESGQ